MSQTKYSPYAVPELDPPLLSNYLSPPASDITNALLSDLVAEIRGLRDDLRQARLYADLERLGITQEPQS